MLKKVLAVTALAGAAALTATSASAVLCADVYVQVNETVQAQSVCV